MAWNEKEPVPNTHAGKKNMVKEMFKPGSTKGAEDDGTDNIHNTDSGNQIKGEFDSAHITKADNGFKLEVNRNIKKGVDNSKQLGSDQAIPSAPNVGESERKTYSTVHMRPEHVMTHLGRHMVKGQVGSIGNEEE